jgi:uncharacterized protein (TIGR02271 family)
MTKTVVALYDSASDAETVSSELSAAGFTDTDVVDNSAIGSTGTGWSGTGMTDASLAAGAPGVVGTPLGAVSDTETSTTTSSAVSEGILGRLRRAGVPEDESHVYAEGVRRGGSLVIARLADENVDRGLEIMSNYRPVDIDERGSQWRTEGWSRYDESAGPYTGTGLTEAASSMRSTNETAATRSDRTDLDTSATLAGDTGRARSGDETVIPIVEEQLSVGKREVERGGVRVRSYVVETPVEESVRLRDETINVERRAVNRPADVTADAFRERTIELTETDEEAVVAKTARVVEEVVVSKDVTERTEQISDTVRRTEVDVENTTGVERAVDRDVDRDLKADRTVTPKRDI